MVPEKQRKIAKLLSLAVIVGGMLAVAGWMFDIPILTSLSPQWRSMRLITAFGFVLSGITVYFIILAVEGKFNEAQVILSMTSFTLVLLMGVSSFANVLGLSGVEDLFIKGADAQERTAILGRPSMLAILNFMLIVCAAIMVMWRAGNLQPKLRTIGVIIAVIGAIATLGYIINVPVLYPFTQGQGSAMACNTAVLFVLLGTGLLCL